jgi:ADP-Ribosyltransferase in polyvalent proteins
MMAGLLDFLMDEQARRDMLGNARNIAQSASNAISGNVTGPIDLAAWGMNKLGIPVGNAPVGGTEWGKKKGLLGYVEPGAGQVLGETLGSLAPILAAAKAPQIAARMNKMADNAMRPATMNPQTGAIVWHGSPHKFDKFDSSKIGTGEGAQAYGHGLYLADSKKVADEYAGKLSKPIVDFYHKSPSDSYEMAIRERLQTLAETTQQGHKYEALKNAFDDYLNPRLWRYDPKNPLANSYNGTVSLEGKELENAIAYRDAATRLGQFELSDSGSLYKVDLPDEHIAKMLDWDKPLSQQHPELQKMLEPLGYSTKAQVSQYDDDLLAALNGGSTAPSQKIRDPLGSDIARGGGLFDSKAQIEKAKRLQELGIPGIRYLDGGSRGAGQGTSNYVIFPGNEGLLTILERNGMAANGLLGGK